MNIYDFSAVTNAGVEKSFADFKGKVLLIVNTASKCGFTPQFDDLEKLNQMYKDQGLVVLGFPCNQFLEQDPESNEKIAEFCRLNYGVTFQLFQKGDVRGDTAQPVFKYLTEQKGFKGFDKEHELTKILEDLLPNKFPEIYAGDGIKWNFTKFLISRDGEVVERFEPTASFDKIESAIKEQL